MSIILATQEVEIGKIVVLGEPGQKVHENPISIIRSTRGGAHLSY
jgi:hypothetical protein